MASVTSTTTWTTPYASVRAVKPHATNFGTYNPCATNTASLEMSEEQLQLCTSHNGATASGFIKRTQRREFSTSSEADTRPRSDCHIKDETKSQHNLKGDRSTMEPEVLASEKTSTHATSDEDGDWIMQDAPLV